MQTNSCDEQSYHCQKLHIHIDWWTTPLFGLHHFFFLPFSSKCEKIHLKWLIKAVLCISQTEPQTSTVSRFWGINSQNSQKSEVFNRHSIMSCFESSWKIPWKHRKWGFQPLCLLRGLQCSQSLQGTLKNVHPQWFLLTTLDFFYDTLWLWCYIC